MADYVKMIIMDFWHTVVEMSPYLLFGFFVAGLLSALIPQRLVEKHLGGRGILPVLKASLFGVPLPLCSCSVIPVSMSLRKHGASRGSTIAFLLSTPQTGVDSIFVTYSLLGLLFAIFRPVVALVTGIIGGILVDIFEKGPNGKEGQGEELPKCSDHCCNSRGAVGRIVGGLRYGFVTLPRDIGRPMLIGLVVAAAITAFVPEGYFAEKLGTGILAMVVMMLVGIPIYVCATASVPIAAALILKGLTPGAAFVFLMTGPATNAASFVTIWRILGGRTAIIYLATVAGCAILSGILLDYIAAGLNFQAVARPGWMLPHSVSFISAVVLLAMLVFGIFSKSRVKNSTKKL